MHEGAASAGRCAIASRTRRRGALKSYEHRSDESGRWLRMEFCPACGTTVTWTLELSPDGRGVAGGTFGDPSWIRIARQHWMPIPPDTDTFEKSSVK